MAAKAARRPSAGKPVLVLNGPNLNMLGVRQPEIYGRDTLADIEQACAAEAEQTSSSRSTSGSPTTRASWSTGSRRPATADGIVINAGAYSHTSVAILDALNAAELPVIEVHLSNIFRREAFRHHSYVCAGGDRRDRAASAATAMSGARGDGRLLARLTTDPAERPP